MKTKLTRLFVALVWLALPAVVQAQDAYSTNADGSIYTYSTNADGSANIVAYAGPPWVVTIPTNINGLTVTSIGTNVFYGTSLTSVAIPDSVTSIRDNAFSYCHSLTNATIGNGVTTIGNSAFLSCGDLTSVAIPNSVTSIGFGAFEFSGITNVTIPNSVTNIEDAFYDCKVLRNVTIGNSVTSIAGAFEGCTSLTSVAIPNSVTTIGDNAFYYCLHLTNVTIPNSATSIGQLAFFYCTSLTNFTLPNSVTSIGDAAFEYCTSLTSATIPGSVTYIGNGAFFACWSLTNVTLPNSITTIGVETFTGCSRLMSVTIPNSVTSIGTYAFSDCTSLTSVYFTGNAPSPTNDSTVFSGDPATVYYLPGTTGWGAMFDGLPTAPWFLPDPLILDHSAGFGVQPGGFGFTISWATNASVVVEAATNLANPVWMPVSTSILTSGTNYFSDPQWTNYPTRFYRAARAFTVGGTLTGLPAGDTVTLQDNGTDNLTLSNNGPFTFPTAVADGQSYSVTFKATTSRFGAYTFFTNGSGTISAANVTNVAVTFTPVYTGDMDLDIHNAAIADGTDNGGVPGIMFTPNGGPFKVTAEGGPHSHSINVAKIYAGASGSGCVFTYVVGNLSCSSTTFTNGTPVIQFGNVLSCGFGPFEY